MVTTRAREAIWWDRGMNDRRDRLEAAARLWRCTVDGPVVRGGMSVVVPVRSADGTPLMIKVLEIEAAEREALALRAFPASASVRCFEHAEDLGALLLERLSSTSLSGRPVDEQITVQAELARRLAVPAPEGIPRLADVDHTIEHLDGLVRDSPGVVDDRVVDAAREAIGDLGQDSTDTLTHGDLHTINVHQDQAGRWRALDPSPWVGTIAHESHTVVVERPRLGELIAAGEPELRRRLALFAEVAEVGRNLSARLCQARAVMSALAEHRRGATEVAADLRRMAELITPAKPPPC